MKFAFPSRARKKPSPTHNPHSTNTRNALSDVLWTSLLALEQSADAFPPLKSAVGGVKALCDIAERAKHSKADAHDIALRTKAILDVIAEAVPDGSAIPLPMLESIERFTVLLEEIRGSIETIALTGVKSRLLHLNRNEGTIKAIKERLDDAYRDFVAACMLRVEVQQSSTHIAVAKVSSDTALISAQVSDVLLYSRLGVFLAHP
ncbi:hypothetical protein FB451DRAFT_1371445 [Mycena latifolia]|nr:hypothetical protein FB451DRAFT_1371445 [Mycena latifolia]